MYSSNTKIFLSIIFSVIILLSAEYIRKNFYQVKNNLYQAPNLFFNYLKNNNPLSFKKNLNLASNNQNLQNNNNNYNSFFNLPTSPLRYDNISQKPPTPTIFNEEKEILNLKYFEYEKIITPTKIQTNKPKSTISPKPTTIPTPTPIKTDQRPGSTLEEIFQEVNKRKCVPIALLKAFQVMESGAYFSLDTPKEKIKKYNRYGWWVDGSGDPCEGLGYYFQTGIIPPDSVRAGERCAPPVGRQDINLKEMGIFSITERDQETTKKYLKNDFVVPYDRRVLFDNALIFAVITRNRIPGGPPPNCDKWPDEIVKIVAEKQAGQCNYYYSQTGRSGNYCQEILSLYHKFLK